MSEKRYKWISEENCWWDNLTLQPVHASDVDAEEEMRPQMKRTHAPPVGLFYGKPLVPERWVKTCETCRFWWAGSKGETGECRRHAPVFVPHPDLVHHAPDATKAPDCYLHGHWPTIGKYGWCGEWALSPDAEPLKEGE